MKIDWKLKGSNLFHFDCSKDATVHPETCLSQVLTEHDGNSSLNDWITTDSGNHSYELKASLKDWLIAYYPLSAQIGFYDLIGDSNVISLGYFTGDTAATNEYIKVPYGTGSDKGVLQVNTATGLSVSSGIISANIAASNRLGVIKGGYVANGNNKPVQISLDGSAFVDISGGTAQATLEGWNVNTQETFQLDPAPLMYSNNSDSFGSVDLSNYAETYRSMYSNTPLADKIYPVRTDVSGKSYVYVPWSQTAAPRRFTATVDGLVPAPGVSSANTYLKANGTWGEPPYPTRFGTNNDGLVPYPTGTNAANYLRGDGTWQNVTAEFVGATASVAGSKGMVPAPAVADKEKFLKGDGTWGNEDMSSYSTLTMEPITDDISIDVEENTKYVYTTSMESAADYKFTVSSIQDSCRESIIIIKDDNVTPVVKSIYLPKNLIYKIDGVLYTQLTYPEDNYINLDSSLILIRISHSIVYLDYIK